VTGHRPRRAVLLLTLLAFLATLLSACSGGPKHQLEAKPLATGPAAGDHDPALDRFYDQDVSWRECRVSLQCATVTVPLDYDRPAGRTLELSLIRDPSRDPDQRIGAMLLNPGGPGVSGVDYAARADGAVGSELTAAYDLVGFDPRGVGESTPLECGDDALRDQLLASDPDPDTPAEVREAHRLIGELARGCMRDDAELTRHVSTEESARDMDIIRAAALGQDRLVYYGGSYGTYLGAWYAELFPDRVGRMVLDGAVDPELGSVGTGLGQARGFEGALRAYAAACVAAGDCYLGGSVDAATDRVRGFLESLDEAPQEVGSRELTEGLATQGVWATLYRRETWSVLDVALGQALRGNGAPLISIVDQFYGRGPDGYTSNTLDAFYAISCLDNGGSAPTDAQAAALVPRFSKAAPTFGSMFAWGTVACAGWPAATKSAQHPLHGQGADPLLVVGTTGDPATPLPWAEALAQDLDSAVLVRRQGEGHTGYHKGNDCVDSTVEKYFVSGTVPSGTVDC
jgi:pimeloyl-ACP methyl ester carboxylesterase